MDGMEVAAAVKEVLANESPKFKIIDLKENIIANGQNVNAEVKNISISSSKTKLRNGTWAK